MKIKIIKASKPTMWYANYIGEVFEAKSMADVEFGCEILYENMPIEERIKDTNMYSGCVNLKDYVVIDPLSSVGS